MDSAKSGVQQEKEKQIELKLTTVQKIIRNKFKKACSDRRAHERNERNAMKTITTKNAHELKSSVARTDNITSSPVSNKSIKIEMNDPNDLCYRLQKILSSPNALNALQIKKKNEIINKLQQINLLI